MKKAFVSHLCAYAQAHEDLYLMCGDLGYGVLNPFREQFGERFINAGICEQNMTSVAAGMALGGKNVFTYSIANFPTLRPLEQIRNDVAHHDANVTIVAVGGGFSYGPLGMSHHATEDLAILRALPNMTVFTPCDPEEAGAATDLAAKTPHPCYLRLGRGGEPSIPHIRKDYRLGGASVLREGKDLAILCAGAIASEALAAAEQLSAAGIDCDVRSFFTIKPMNEAAVLEAAKRYPLLVTVEEGNVTGGFGSAVTEICAAAGAQTRVVRMGLQDEYTNVIGSQAYLRDTYGLSAAKLAANIQALWRQA